MNCNEEHKETDLIIKNLSICQSGIGRHKCASCAYDKGFQNGRDKIIDFNLEEVIKELPESQKGDRRHKNATEAYSLGFFNGLNDGKHHSIVKDKLKMAHQMQHYALHSIAKGLINCTINEKGKPYSHAMGLVQVANGFEVLIKSRIVEEHPLLIFNKIPKDSHVKDNNIEFENLLENGQTIMYSELPDRLWATTGYKISNMELYKKFGSIRNQIIHFSIPEEELSDITLKYTFEIIEIFINDTWNTSILEYALEYNKDLQYIINKLKKLNIKINYTLDENMIVKKL